MGRKISVVIPIFNSSTYIRKTIDSVISNNSSFELDIILVDDCSDDIQSLKSNIRLYDCVRLIEKEKKTNAADSRNIGFKSSFGEYVFFLDSDDLYDSDYLCSRVEIMDSHDYGVFFGGFYLFDGVREIYEEHTVYDAFNISDYIFEMNGDFRSSTISINKKHHKGTLFDSRQFKHQDWGFGILCYKNNERIGYDNNSKVCLCNNRHEQMSSKMNVSASKYFIINYMESKKHYASFVMKHYYIATLNNDKEALFFLDGLLQQCKVNKKLFTKIIIMRSMRMKVIGKIIRPLVIRFKKR